MYQGGGAIRRVRVFRRQLPRTRVLRTAVSRWTHDYFQCVRVPNEATSDLLLGFVYAGIWGSSGRSIPSLGAGLALGALLCNCNVR